MILHLIEITSIKKGYDSYPRTGTDDEDQEYDQLQAWGPRFDKLSTMYGPEQNVVHDLEEL